MFDILYNTIGFCQPFDTEFDTEFDIEFDTEFDVIVHVLYMCPKSYMI